jgi:MFS family permease
MIRTKQSRIFPGWWVVVGAFLCMMTGYAVAYSFAAFFAALEGEFGARRGETALVFSISAFLYFLLGLPAGLIADRTGPRPVVVGGLLLIAVGLVVAAQASSLWQVYLGYGLGVGVGIGFSYVTAWRPCSAGLCAIAARRAASPSPASAWALLGARSAHYLIAPRLAPDLSCWPSFRRRAMSRRAGATGPRACWPHARRQSAPSKRREFKPFGLSLGEAVRSGPFWAIYVGALLMSFGLFVRSCTSPLRQRPRLGQGFGVFLIVLLGVGGTVGRFLFASVTGWIGRRLSFAMMYIGAGVLLVMWSQSTSAAALMIFALVFGAFYGGFVAIAPSLAADYFGGRALGAVIGALYSGVAFGSLLGPPVAGYAFDFFGSYAGAILAGAALCLVSFVITLMTPEPARWLAGRKPAP